MSKFGPRLKMGGITPLGQGKREGRKRKNKTQNQALLANSHDIKLALHRSIRSQQNHTGKNN